MNNEHQENRALTGPLIFTVPDLRFSSWLFISIGLASPIGQLFPPKPLRKRLKQSTPCEFYYLENEAFKAKLPTLLQSKDRPSVFHSWGGGVMYEQINSGYKIGADHEVQLAGPRSSLPSPARRGTTSVSI